MITLNGLWDRAQRARLATKLAWLSASLTALVVFVAFALVSAHIRASTSQQFAKQLGRAARPLVAVQKTQLDQIVVSASILTGSGPLRGALAARRDVTTEAELDFYIQTVEKALTNQAPSLDGEIALVTDDSGHVFAGVGVTNGRTVRGLDLSHMPAVRRVLDPASPEEGQMGILILEGETYRVGAYPIVVYGVTVGSLLIGERLERFLGVARIAFDGVYAVTVGDRLISSTLEPRDTSATVAALSGSGAHDTEAKEVNVDGEAHVVAMLPLGENQDGVPVQLWMLQPLAPGVEALTKPVTLYFLIYGTLAVILAGIGAAFVARSVLKPFGRFVEYMGSGTAVERLQTKFDASSASPEVQTLNESFTKLMSALAEERRQLERRTTELVAANTGLREEVRERERVQKALIESEEQLRQSQKLEAIGTLAGGIAHDFNNLLTVISGYTQLALLRSTKGSPAADDLRQVVDAAERAAKLVHQLLAFSRKQVMSPTVLDMAEVVTNVAPMLERLIGEQIELRIDSDEQLARIWADRGQLEQVIINLVVNARDAMPGGGVLTIKTGNVMRSTRATGDTVGVLLAVSDTGTGIPDAIRERIFEPFFTTKELGKGTGLGLSTVYGIVKQSGGTIDVESAPGAGTTFTVTMPVADDLAGPISGWTGETAAPERGTETILLVEDEVEVRALARRTLEECGYTVIAAGDAMEAINLAEEARIDAVLTDIVMPSLTGPEVVQRVRGHHPAVTVVYMSGYADEAIAAFEMEQGSTFLRKPFTPVSLARVVRGALDAATPAESEVGD